MSFQGLRNWPPEWRLTSGTRVTHPAGEIGTLEHVQPSVVDPRTCHVTMSHDGCYYVGQLSLMTMPRD